MPPVVVSLDVFPARVTFPDDAVISKARVIIADGVLYVYVMANGEPTEYYTRGVFSTEGANPVSGVNIQVEDGLVRVKKAGGCGCGNRLKNFNPWPGRVRARAGSL